MSEGFKKIISYINCENEQPEKVIREARSYENNGADALFLYSHTENESERENVLTLIKEVVRRVDIPVMAGCRVRSFEDIKKAYYTGAKQVVVCYDDVCDNELLKQGSERFGREAMVLEVNLEAEAMTGFFYDEQLKKAEYYGMLLFKHVDVSEKLKGIIAEQPIPVIIRDSLIRNDMETLISMENVCGVATNFYSEKSLPSENLYSDGEAVPAGKDIMKVKRNLKTSGVNVDIFESSLSFADLEKNSAGLVPCIVQDYRNDEVLMLAYMNEESFNKTIETGIMTYFSRSRQELWIKGGTSGHFQYVKELKADCDRDTLLAKVNQIGAACHTGSRSCFFNEMLKHEYDEKNAFAVLSDLYKVVADRKANPREGSYTNYLFDKGMDKILKKCGEEAAEMIIAAKNPNAEELKYEMADLLYHMTVLMVECGVDWEDVVEELAKR